MVSVSSVGHVAESDNTGQQRFCPMRKYICFWCIFARWIQICFQNFSITHTFCSRLKGWYLLRQDTKVYFYHGCHEEFKDFFSQEDGVMFCSDVYSVMEVLGHKYNPDQWRFFTNSSKVSLKVVHSTTEIDSPLFLWLMQPTWRKVMKAWSYCWERLSMMNLSGSYVVISRLWHCYSECNWVTQNTAVSCVSGAAETRRITT